MDLGNAGLVASPQNRLASELRLGNILETYMEVGIWPQLQFQS